MSNLASTEIIGFGLYQYNQDVHDGLMAECTVTKLREQVFGGCEGMEAGTRTKVWKLRKNQLAAMVAEWDTSASENYIATATTPDSGRL